VYTVVGPNEEILTSAYEMLKDMATQEGYEVVKEAFITEERHLSRFDVRHCPKFSLTVRSEMYVEVLFPLR
jgi:hypothetical protein